jgi:outer membrane protein TolC
MVRLLFLGLSLWLSLPVHAQSKAQTFELTPKQVAELVLKQSYRAQEVNLTAQQVRLKLAEVEKLYDFQFLLESGYQKSKFETVGSSSLAADQRYTTSASLKKPFFTGTTLGFEYTQLSDRPEFSSTATNTYNNYTENIFGVTLEQSLLQNFFGVSSRANLRAANQTVKAAEVDRVSNLQSLVLESIRAYWSTYVAQQAFQEALNSRNRYAKLVETVKKKSGYGYSNPGELAQAQAELEGREQTVKTASSDYLAKLDSLLTLLKLPANSEIKFIVQEDIPTPPKIENVDIEKLRPLKSTQLKSEAARETLRAVNALGYPDIALVGKYYNQGLEENGSDAYSEMVGGSRPKYYVGVKLTYNFGSSYDAEYLLNARVNRDLAETALARQRLELADKQNSVARNIQATYAIALSARAQRNFREKASQELNKAYNQGRTEIATFIDVLNKYFDSEVALSRAIGNYQISLNEWAAFKDELIPDNKDQSKKEN